MNLALFKKYLVLEICGVVILVALIAVGVKLVTTMRRYAGEKSALQAIMDRKQQLDRRSPYPSRENVRLEAENFKDILDNYNDLNEMLRARQIEPQMMQPAEFMPLLENSLRRLRTQLANAHVIYPPKFTFGFDRYAGGKLPAAGDIPRLVQQLKIIDALCQTLCQVGIDELVSLSREEVEAGQTAESGARSARGAPPPATPGGQPGEENLLYTTQHFKLTVKAGEAAIMDLLNLFARLPMFMIVNSLEMVNSKPTLREGAGASAAPAAAGTATTNAATEDLFGRERRLVLGKELVELKLELDVYQFAPSLNFKKNARKN